MSARRPLSQVVHCADFFAGHAALAMQVPKAADASEVTALLAEAASMIGADAAAFASFVHDDEAYASYRFILACDANWCLAYESGACYMHDPWLEYARHHAEPVLADSVPVRTESERSVVSLAQEFGFASALIVPAHSPQGLTRLGALCFGSAQAGYFTTDELPAVGYATTALAMRLHEWQIAQLRRELLDHARLSGEDMVLLQHQRLGHGSKQIATALHTTAMSVDSRWQRLNAKLGVSTRLAAAKLAAEYGLI